MRVRIARKCAREEKLAARKFIPHLRKRIIPVLSSHAKRMLADDPRKIVHRLEHSVVDLKWAARRVAERRQIVAENDIRDSPGILVRNLHRHADFLIHVLDACKLLRDVVKQ